MPFPTTNIRKTLTYLFIGILLLGFYEYLWSDLSSFWQKISMILTAVFLFSFIKEFVFWIFSFLSSFWSFIFKSIIVVFGFLLAWFYIFSDYSNTSFKKNHIEIRNDIRNFFKLPTSSPFAKNTQDILVVPSSTEATRDSLVDLLLKNTDSDSNKTTTKTTEVSNATEATKEITPEKNTIKLQYINDANKNWKAPIQKELQEDQDLIFSRKLKSKINTTIYKPTATTAPETANNNKNTKNYLYFTKTPVQVAYPQNYSFENTQYNITTPETGLIEEITTDITNLTTQKKEATAQYKIYSSGKLYDKYINEFKTIPSSSSNTFYIESTTLNEVQYVTFFAGKCWVITFTKEGKNNTLDDFYKVLIPAVFEAQD